MRGSAWRSNFLARKPLLTLCSFPFIAHRGDNLRTAIVKTWNRGGVFGFYQGLIPWAWIEASTKGAVLMLASSESTVALPLTVSCLCFA